MNPFRTLRAAFICAAACATSFAAPAAYADELPRPDGAYTGVADITAGDMRMTMRIWADGADQRSEGEIAGRRQIIIVRGDAGLAYMLDPESNTGMEMQLTPEMASVNLAMYGWNATKTGEETINGASATRYSVEGENPLGGALTGELWFNEAGVLVRAVTTSEINGAPVESAYDLTEVAVAPVDPALFEPPAGMEMMSIGQ